MYKGKKCFTVINEQHSLMEDQRRVIKEVFGVKSNTSDDIFVDIEYIKIPKEGLSKNEIRDLSFNLYNKAKDEDGVIVIISPIPMLIKELTAMVFLTEGQSDSLAPNTDVLIMHNDRREKKELPNGKIISVVAKEGWELV